MTRRSRILAVSLVLVAIGVAAVFFIRDRADEGLSSVPFVASSGFPGEGKAVACQGSVVELEFDPEGHIEARAHGKTIAVADLANGELNYDVCNETPRPHAFNQRGVR